MDTVKIILASLFDFFKLKSPVIAAGVMSVLTLIAVNFNQIIADFNITNATVIEIAKWTNLILLAITGSRTSNILNTPTEEIKAEA